MRFLASFYVHLGLFRATLFVRTVSDLRAGLRLLNVVTVLVFVANTVVAVAAAAGVRAKEELGPRP
jgi:hypothetical protein